ncbi:protein kinase [Paenarthrobacter sp. NPDC058040]|uniref:serine/threonine-protein kinase n=1 Tax=unclassified Paenarthrobacter TaxID=2634190 RepID=UPI0036D9A67D
MANNDVAGVSESSDGLLGGRYQLGRILGRGAMSTVYQAQDVRLGRDVAVKLFLPGSGDESFRVRQETEMRLLAAFDHPGLVRAFDAGVDTRNDEERAFLVMELAEGRDLRAALAEGPMKVADVSAIGVRLAGALAQVHRQGVIHRDIKPANILVSDGSGSSRSVKLADFGVALVMSENRLTATGFTVGTAQYLSPEQAQGLHLTPASDIYSLGLVLLECLTGKAEYPGTPMETAAARLHRAPQIPSNLPEKLRTLLRAMTDMDPERRPKASDVEAVLASPRRRFAAGRTAILPPVPSRAPHVPPGRRATRAMAFGRAAAFGKARHKLLGGVAVAAAGIPVAVALFIHGVSVTGMSEPSRTADPSVSVTDRQPSIPVDPANTAPAEAVPAANVEPVQEPAQPVHANLPAQPTPASTSGTVGGANGKDRASVKSDRKSDSKGDKKAPKDKGNDNQD